MTEVAQRAEVSVKSGETIARRFVIVREAEADLPGLARYEGRDTRLGADVTIDLISSLAPSSVVRAAQRARVLRDRRLTRVLAAGFERDGDDRLAYVVSERPRGVRLDQLIGRVAFAPASAASVVGGATAALVGAAQAGEHHGALRAACIAVTREGRVMVSGLGADGELFAQAGLGRGRSEKADATALARLYLAAVTAMDADDATESDLPADLPDAARALCADVIKGVGPHTLAAITAALGTGDAGVLRSLVAEAPRLWWPAASPVVPAEEPEASDAAAEAGEAVPDTVAPDAAVPDEDADAAPEVLEPVDDADAAPEAPDAETDAEPAEPGADLAAPAEPTSPAEPAEPAPPARPRTRFGGAVDDLDEFHDIVTDQNELIAPSVAEALMDRLHGRFPRSARLARAAEAAHRRAQAPAPIRPAAFLVALFIVGMFVATTVAISYIQRPIEPPGGGNPPDPYPEYSFGATASPTPGG